MHKLLIELKYRRVVFFNNEQKWVLIRASYALVKHFYQHRQVVVEFGLNFLWLLDLKEELIDVAHVLVAEEEIFGALDLYLDYVRLLLAAL